MLAQGTLQGINTEIIIQGHRDFPEQHIATGPIHYGRQINKAVCQPNVSDTGTSHLINPCNRDLFQQVRMHLMPLSLPAGVWLGSY